MEEGEREREAKRAKKNSTGNPRDKDERNREGETPKESRKSVQRPLLPSSFLTLPSNHTGHHGEREEEGDQERGRITETKRGRDTKRLEGLP